MMLRTDSSVQIMGCRGELGPVDDFIRKARDFISDENILLQFLDSDCVLGKEHVLRAVELANRAFDFNHNISQSLAMEILIYVSGESQITLALKKVGLKDGCKKCAAVADEHVNLSGLLEHLGLQRDDSVLDYSEAKLLNFGINREEIASVPQERRCDLVLERLALVDVKK